jgi:hypothetical protein
MLLLTPEQIAEEHGTTKQVIWALIRSKQLDHIFLSPKKARIPVGAFEEYVERNMVKAK